MCVNGLFKKNSIRVLSLVIFPWYIDEALICRVGGVKELVR